MLATLQRLQGERLIDLEDAVYATRDAGGKVKLHQSHTLTAEGAVSGALWGTVHGLSLMVPLLGGLIGAGLGALSGKFTDLGIEDGFIKDLAAQPQPGSSAIFLLVRQATPDRVVPEVSKFGGTVPRTSLSKEAETKLQAALTEGAGTPPSGTAAAAAGPAAAATA